MRYIGDKVRPQGFHTGKLFGELVDILGDHIDFIGKRGDFRTFHTNGKIPLPHFFRCFPDAVKRTADGIVAPQKIDQRK